MLIFSKNMATMSNSRVNLKSLFYFSLVIGLYGSVTNLVFISILPSLTAIILMPFIIAKKRLLVVPKFIFFLYLFFIYSFCSIIIYYPPSLLSYDFYRYDGNFIISYAPLLIAPFYCYKFDEVTFLKRFLVFVTVLNSIVFLIVLGISNFALLHDWNNPANYFHALFKSTNAAGGFISIILTLNIIVYLSERKLVWVILIFLNLIFLLATTSRGSLLGLLAGFLLFYLEFKNRRGWIVAIIASICVCQATILMVSYPIFNDYIRESDLSDYINNNNINDIDANAYIPSFLSVSDTKSANLIIRLIDTWPRGIDEFIHSPIFGAGFGSVNDVPLTYKGIDHFITLNSQINKKFDDAHAHHSYLHIMGELGIVGFVIFLLFWVSLYSYIRKNELGVYRDFLLVSYFNLSIMSFTEHRITSPSNALPFVIAMCLFMLRRRYNSASGYLLQ